MKKFLQRRHKGAILATCFVSMTVIMLLSSTIFFFVQLLDSSTRQQEAQFEQRRVVSELGDKFVAGTFSDADLPEGWSADVSEDGSTLVLKKGAQVLLTVQIDEEKHILLWKTGSVENDSSESSAESSAGE